MHENGRPKQQIPIFPSKQTCVKYMPKLPCPVRLLPSLAGRDRGCWGIIDAQLADLILHICLNDSLVYWLMDGRAALVLHLDVQQGHDMIPANTQGVLVHLQDVLEDES